MDRIGRELEQKCRTFGVVRSEFRFREGNAYTRSGDLSRKRAILQDRRRGQSLGQLARNYGASRATIHRLLHERAPISGAGMIEKAADFIPAWVVLSAAFGFIVDEACGELLSDRRWLRQANEELRDRLEEDAACTEPIHRALKQQRSVINDIHSRLVAVSKALEKRPS